MTIWLIAALIVAQRLWELRRASVNRQRLLAMGGREYSSGHYPLFFLLHGAWLVGWLVEGQINQPLLSSGWLFWLILFVCAQILRYWCILSLGPYWNTRILVLPGASKVKAGPYRYLPHPNYLAVSVELVAVPMVFDAWITAALATLGNAVLLLAVRIPAEEEALRSNLT